MVNTNQTNWKHAGARCGQTEQVEDRTEWRQRVTGSTPWTGGGKTFNKSEPEYDCQSVGHSWSTFQMILPRKKLLMLAPTWKCSAAISKAQSISTVGKSCYQEKHDNLMVQKKRASNKARFFFATCFGSFSRQSADLTRSGHSKIAEKAKPFSFDAQIKKKLINQTKSQNKLISVRGGGVRTTTISERSHSTVE